LKKRLLLAVLLSLFVMAPVVSHGARKPAVTKVRSALKKLGISNAKILGVESAPIKNLYLVYVDLGRNGRRGFIITRDTKYVISGRLLDVGKKGADLIMETGIDKGYFPLPRGKAVNIRISTTGSPAFGPAKAPEVIIYYDPFCPFSLRELRVLRAMANEGKIHLVLKYFIFNGPNARRLARDSICLYQQGRTREFWAMVFTKGAIAKRLKLLCKENQVELIELLLTRDGEEARKMKLKGTPSLYINGKVYTGFINRPMLERLLLTGGRGQR